MLMSFQRSSLVMKPELKIKEINIYFDLKFSQIDKQKLCYPLDNLCLLRNL